MGGIGSGRRIQNPSITQFLQLDVRRLERLGVLRIGAANSLQWTKDGTVKMRASVFSRASGLTIRCKLFTICAEGTDATYYVIIVKTPCNFGGSRSWLVCPECSRRAAILYCGDKRLTCRACRRPTYPIQTVAPMGRALARAQKLRTKLGGSVDLDMPFPERPKGMHSFTYTKLAIRAMLAEAQFNAEVRTWTDQILSPRG